MISITEVVLSTLLIVSFTQGKIYNTTRMEPIEEYAETSVERCVRPLDAETSMETRLSVQSTAAYITAFAGQAVITSERLSPVNTWHTLTIRHDEVSSRHVLNVTINNNDIPFVMDGSGRWFTTAYSFQNIVLYAKGKVEIEDCPPPEDFPYSTTVSTNEDVAVGGATWMWSLGEVAGVPVVALIIVALAILVVAIVVVFFVCHRRREHQKRLAGVDGDRQSEYRPVDTSGKVDGANSSV